MELDRIEDLLKKYNNAETSLQEEAELSTYFKSNNVAPHLAHYKALFQYFSEAQHEEFTKDVPLNTKRRYNSYGWISVAAVIVVMIGLYVPNLFGPSEEELKQQEEAQLAYEQTVKALNLLSIGVNQGRSELNALTMVGENLNQGLDEVNRLHHFAKTKNEIFNLSN